jgi:hypothetical protein
MGITYKSLSQQDALVSYIIGIYPALVEIGHSNYNLSSCVPESYNYSMLIEHFVEERRNKMVDSSHTNHCHSSFED